jgi:hypothetical protein
MWVVRGATGDELAAHNTVAVVFERMLRRSRALD